MDDQIEENKPEEEIVTFKSLVNIFNFYYFNLKFDFPLGFE